MNFETRQQLTTRIEKELTSNGMVYPPCLQWSISDIELSLARLLIDRHWSDRMKLHMLEDFFVQNDEAIIEYINTMLDNFLDRHFEQQYNLNDQ